MHGLMYSRMMFWQPVSGIEAQQEFNNRMSQMGSAKQIEQMPIEIKRSFNSPPGPQILDSCGILQLPFLIQSDEGRASTMLPGMGHAGKLHYLS